MLAWIHRVLASCNAKRGISDSTRSQHWLRAAMDGTVYCKYYQISSEQSTESTPASDDASDQLAFASLCATRARQLGMDDRDRALSSRMMLEQARILTTHNMATLFVTFDLHERLDELDAPAILQRCWHQIHAMITYMMTTSGITPAPVQRARAAIGELWW
ncbi:hypothetical protein FI667_g7450, partial [Globisporangium splendens]